MAQEVSTLSSFRIGKLTERVAMLERALIDTGAQLAFARTAQGRNQSWTTLPGKDKQHYRDVIENELVREGLVRPRNVREMER